MTITNCAVGFPALNGLVPAWDMAESFGAGRIASAVDVADLRASSPSTSPIWHNWWTTNSAEFYGLSPAGRPVVAVLHGTGPLSRLRGAESVMAAYSWEFKAKNGERRGGRISTKIFHEILDGKHGPVFTSDFVTDTGGAYFPGDGNTAVEAERALRSSWVQARLGGFDRAQRYLEAIATRAIERAEAIEGVSRSQQGVERMAMLACSQSDRAPCWKYVFPETGLAELHYGPELKDIAGDHATAGLLVMEPVRSARQGGGFSTGIGIQDWNDPVKFIGMRQGGAAMSVHLFAFDKAVDHDADLLSRPFAGHTGFLTLMRTPSGNLAVQHPKRGNAPDTGAAMCLVTEADEICTSIFEPEGTQLWVFSYALKEIVRIAPPGANAYLLDNISEDNQRAEVTFFKVRADLGERIMKQEEAESDVDLVVKLAERQISRERVEAVVAEPVTKSEDRDVVTSFWSLPMGDRRLVCERLDLISSSDGGLPEAQRYTLAFMRAERDGLVERLRREIAKFAA
jgi:hypothetical protein